MPSLNLRLYLTDVRKEFRSATKPLLNRQQEKSEDALRRAMTKMRIALISLASYIAFFACVALVFNGMDGDDDIDNTEKNEEEFNSIGLFALILLYAPVLSIVHSLSLLYYSGPHTNRIVSIASITLDTLTTTSYLSWAFVLALYVPAVPEELSFIDFSDPDWVAIVLEKSVILAMWFAASANFFLLIGSSREFYLGVKEGDEEADLESGTVRVPRKEVERRGREERKKRLEEFRAWREAEEEKRALAELYGVL